MSPIVRLRELALAVEKGGARDAEQKELAAAVLDLFGREWADDDSVVFAVKISPELAGMVAPIFLQFGKSLAIVAGAEVPGEQPEAPLAAETH